MGIKELLTTEEDCCDYCKTEGQKCTCGVENIASSFYIARIMPDGNMKREKIKFCPNCGRKLDV